MSDMKLDDASDDEEDKKAEKWYTYMYQFIIFQSFYQINIYSQYL